MEFTHWLAEQRIRSKCLERNLKTDGKGHLCRKWDFILQALGWSVIRAGNPGHTVASSQPLDKSSQLSACSILSITLLLIFPQSINSPQIHRFHDSLLRNSTFQSHLLLTHNYTDINQQFSELASPYYNISFSSLAGFPYSLTIFHSHLLSFFHYFLPICWLLLSLYFLPTFPHITYSPISGCYPLFLFLTYPPVIWAVALFGNM